MSKPAQQEFDETYITSSEICRELRITRTSITQGRERGLLPDPIVVNNGQLIMWRREAVREYLDAWKLMLMAKRGELAV